MTVWQLASALVLLFEIIRAVWLHILMSFLAGFELGTLLGYSLDDRALGHINFEPVKQRVNANSGMGYIVKHVTILNLLMLENLYLNRTMIFKSHFLAVLIFWQNTNFKGHDYVSWTKTFMKTDINAP